MEVLLGIAASIIATLIIAYIISILSLSLQKRIYALIKRPNLYFKIKFNKKSDEAKVALVINKIFKSWNDKKEKEYLSCWSDRAIKVVSDDIDKKYTKIEIQGKFNVSCAKYKSITTEFIVFNEIKVNYPDQDIAIADISYRFFLITDDNSLPVVEDANELYVLEKNNGEWLVKANHDHFKYFSPRNPHLG